MPRGTFQCPRPCGEPLLTHTSTGSPPALAGGFDSVSCGVTTPLLRVLMRAKLCLSPPSLECLFPPVLWESYNEIPLTFRARFPVDFQSLWWIPRLGSLMWSSEPSQQCQNFFGTSVLESVSHLPQRVWNSILSWLHLLYYLTALLLCL